MSAPETAVPEARYPTRRQSLRHVVVALDIEDGSIDGHFQYHWNDAWDWDEGRAPLLIPIERDGQQVEGLVHAGRNGYL